MQALTLALGVMYVELSRLGTKVRWEGAPDGQIGVPLLIAPPAKRKAAQDIDAIVKGFLANL